VGPIGPADPESFDRIQAQAEQELGPEAPSAADAPAARDESDEPDAVDEAPAHEEDPPDVGDVELVVRTGVALIAFVVGRWASPVIGDRVRRAGPAGARRFAEHFGPRLGNGAIWAGLAVACSFLEPRGGGPTGRDDFREVVNGDARVVEAGR
jgi:hypothetical protein